MKNKIVLLLLGVALACSPQAARAATQVKLSENLRLLEPFLGSWNLCWTDLNGKHMSGRATIEPEAGGAIVILKAEFLDTEGAALFSRVSIFFWSAESHCIGERNFDSNGWHGSNVLISQIANKRIWKGFGNTGEGEEGSSLTEMIKVDADRWTAQFTKQVLNGHEISDSPKFTFTRAKE